MPSSRSRDLSSQRNDDVNDVQGTPVRRPRFRVCDLPELDLTSSSSESEEEDDSEGDASFVGPSIVDENHDWTYVMRGFQERLARAKAKGAVVERRHKVVRSSIHDASFVGPSFVGESHDSFVMLGFSERLARAKRAKRMKQLKQLNRSSQQLKFLKQHF